MARTAAATGAAVAGIEKRRSHLGHAALVMAAGLAAACAHAPIDAERIAIIVAQSRIDDALVANDPRALALLLTEDATRTGPGGVMTTREQWLASMTEGQIRYVSAARSDTSIRLTRDSAIVTGLVDIVVEKPDQGRIVEHNRYLRVFVKQDGRWLLAAHQATAAPKR